MFLCHANKQMYDLLLQVRVSIEPSNMQLSLILLDWRRVKSNAKGTLNNGIMYTRPPPPSTRR